MRRSAAGLERWSLADLTLGLYVLSARHAANAAADVVGDQLVTDRTLIKDLLYSVELARAAQAKDVTSIAKLSMLRASRVVKLVDKASSALVFWQPDILRPSYYVAIDDRRQLVVLGVRGTASGRDLMTSLAGHSSEVEGLEAVGGGFSHYGSAEAAKWFVEHELATLRRCLAEHRVRASLPALGFRLRLVGHSLGGATAAILALLLHADAERLLGVPASRISCATFGTPPCLSRDLAIGCSGFVTTVVLQDDVIPRASVAAIDQLRTEILLTDWTAMLKEGAVQKELVDLATSTIAAIANVQDAARRYMQSRPKGLQRSKEETGEGEGPAAPTPAAVVEDVELVAAAKRAQKPQDLFAPGKLYQILRRPCRGVDTPGDGAEAWMVEGEAKERLGRIVLSASLASDHFLFNYYHALREVLKVDWASPLPPRITSTQPLQTQSTLPKG
eukprot:SM000008S22210  [mRNA]  locus=s8:428376:430309:- [translate_table: standard]